MSADNWDVCPRCKMQTEMKRETLEQRLATGYGNLPEEEYLALRKQLSQPIEPAYTLREDYKIGIDENGLFSVVYSGVCAVCKFEYTHRYEAIALKERLSVKEKS